MSWDIPIGTVFAGYKITSVLGRGGMSIVYGAEHVRLGRMVALKLLSPALATDESFQERFIRESQLAASLDHPNIIPIYDAGEAEGFLYLAMRHVDGPDLGTVLEKEGALPLGQALFYIEQVAGALDQAHAQGLVHRDVKPANILIARPSDRVYLSDFGVVKQTSARGLTKTGFFIGTFEYAAPEQIEGKEVDARTDLYALGCVLYECLSGEPPFPAETEGAAIHAHLVDPPPTLTDKRPDLPLRINDVIATAMAKSKEDRYSSCGELVRALRAVALGTTIPGERSVAAPSATVQAPAGTVLAPAGGPPVQPPPAAAPPAGQPPPAPPPAPPAEDGAPRRRRFDFGTKRLVLLGSLLAALIAGGVVAAVVVTGGGGGEKKAASTGMEMEHGNGGSGLLGMFPSDVPTSSCKEMKGEHHGALKTANCDFMSNAGHLYLHVDQFKTHEELDATYKNVGLAEEKAAGGTPDPTLKTPTGACTSVDWRGEGTWAHAAGEEPAGHRACYILDSTDKNCKAAGATGGTQCSVIAWTLDASHLFLRAVLPSTQHRNLLTWWRFHAHLFA